MCFIQARRKQVWPDAAVRWLFGWLVAIGIGSGLFHSVATPWSQLCDVVPIGVFVLTFLGLWLRQVLGWSWQRVALAILGLVVLSGAFLALCRGSEFGGSQGYFGVLVFISVFGIEQRRRFARRPRLLYAAGAFAVALVFRSFDRTWCEAIPLGTHWLWHLLNAFVCYSALMAMIEAKSSVTATSRN